MAHLLYRLTHPMFTRRATLRSLHVLGSALEMGCPLDQSLALTTQLAETWGLQETWGFVAGRMADGGSLSQVMSRLDPPFNSAMAALIELGEVQGDLPRALLLAAGKEKVDVFAAAKVPDQGPYTPKYGAAFWAPGPIERIAQTLVREASNNSAEALGFFLPLPHKMDGPRKWVEERPPCTEVSSRPRDSALASELTVDLHTACPREDNLTEYRDPWTGPEGEFPTEHMRVGTPFDPEALRPGQVAIGTCKQGVWTQLLALQGLVLPSLMRHLMYRAGIPYWTNEPQQGALRIEAGDRRHRLTARFAPSARQLSLTLYFEPAVSAA